MTPYGSLSKKGRVERRKGGKWGKREKGGGKAVRREGGGKEGRKYEGWQKVHR